MEIGMDVSEFGLEGAEYRFDDSIGFLLGRLRSRMSIVLEEHLKALEISTPQWVILMRIANGYGQTSAELCRCFHYDTGAMTRMLDRLEEKGLVQRQRSQTDRRVVELTLTEAGREIYPKLHEAGKWITECILKDFSVEEVALFKSMLQRMRTNLEGNP